MTNRAPNIVFLMPDQLRPDFLGCYGASFCATPNMDRLAARSLVFEQAFSPSPICIPARASLLTGHNALSTGVLTNNFWLRPDHDSCGQPTFAKRLAERGYHTEAIGKMHFIPWDLNEGFQHRVIAEDKRHLHIQDDYAEYLAEHGLRKLAGPEEPEYREGRMASISPIPMEHQVDVWTGRQAVRFLREFSGLQPFFLWVAFPGPHDPYNPPPEVAEQVRNLEVPAALEGTPDSQVFRPGFIQSHLEGSAQADFTEFPQEAKVRIRRHYAGLVQIIDEQIGAILKALEQRDDGRETVIVLASDHGDFLGDYDLVGKALFHEPSVRIPLLACGGPFMPGRSEAWASLTDLFATFLNLAGVSSTAQDSIPLPHRPEEETRASILGATGAGVMLLRKPWKLARYKNGLLTLHHLQDDPNERHNLAGKSEGAPVQQALEAELFQQLLQAVTDGHRDKSYPYMTMTPEHPGHLRGWRRPYPANAWKQSTGPLEGWKQAGMPL